MDKSSNIFDTDALKANALAQAQKYLDEKAAGNQYLMGAKNGPGGQVDCSGLVSNVVMAGTIRKILASKPMEYFCLTSNMCGSRAEGMWYYLLSIIDLVSRKMLHWKSQKSVYLKLFLFLNVVIYNWPDHIL